MPLPTIKKRWKSVTTVAVRMNLLFFARTFTSLLKRRRIGKSSSSRLPNIIQATHVRFLALVSTRSMPVSIIIVIRICMRFHLSRTRKCVTAYALTDLIDAADG